MFPCCVVDGCITSGYFYDVKGLAQLFVLVHTANHSTNETISTMAKIPKTKRLGQLVLQEAERRNRGYPKLRESGLTDAEIARRWGVSRQRVLQIAKRLAEK